MAITATTRDGEKRILSGSATAFLKSFFSRMIKTIDVSQDKSNIDAVTGDEYFKRNCHGLDSEYENGFFLWMCYEPSASFLLKGKQIAAVNVVLNTCMDLGSSDIKFLALLFGYHESHCYVLEENRAWAAGVIANLLKLGIVRETDRWNHLREFLLDIVNHPGEVVFGSTLCESFLYALKDEVPEEEESDESLEWDDALAKLKARGTWLNLSPHTTETQRFAECHTLMDICRGNVN